MIANFFHCEADNVGDLMAGPGQFVWPDQNRSFPLLPQLPRNVGSIDYAILGGGQIFRQLSETMVLLFRNNPRVKIVAWGIGLPKLGKRNKFVHDLAEHCVAFGTRNYEWSDRFDFVPCASCLSPVFDDLPEPSTDVVVYLHRRKGDEVAVPEGIPIMTNAARPSREALEFIASGETVVTSSYHGVYWAQLLGRKVVCIPFSDKFSTFQFAPEYAEASAWRDKLSSAQMLPPLLEEYRKLNVTFAEKVTEAWFGN